jgi:GDP-4-dehydro-6-deoxy-D-mannose reductase
VLKTLITGISGFVGSHLAEYLLANTDWEVAGTVFGDYQHIVPIRTRLMLYPAELSRLAVAKFILEDARPDVIFHLAAMAVTGRSWQDPARTLETNIGMQANILQAVLDLGLGCRVMVIGSSEEYGAIPSDREDIDELAPFRPMNPYAVSKVAQDMLGLQYYLSHRLDTVRIRPFNHIGPRQGLGFVAPDFAYQVARIEADLQEPVIRVGNLEAQRDFTDVRDVVRAYHLLAVKGQSGEVYNVGSGRAHPVQDVLDHFLAHSTVPIDVQHDASRMRPSDIPRVVCNYAKLRACTGWEPQVAFETSLADVLDYWRTRVMEKQ